MEREEEIGRRVRVDTHLMSGRATVLIRLCISIQLSFGHSKGRRALTKWSETELVNTINLSAESAPSRSASFWSYIFIALGTAQDR